jgi:ATP synthase protein I
MAKPDDAPRKWGIAMSVGAVLLSNILGGTALGYFMDKWFGTAPYLLVFGIVLGTVSAFISLYRIMQRLQ